MDVTALRKQIPTTQEMTYLNTGWAGPSPISVVEAVRARLEEESYGARTSPEMVESGKALRRTAQAAIASLVHASPQEILLTENTTEGLNILSVIVQGRITRSPTESRTTGNETTG